MAHPMKGMARSSNPKWLGRLQRERGGRASEQRSITFSDLEANHMYTKGDGEGRTSSAGAARMTNPIKDPSGTGDYYRHDTNLATDTDFGEAHDVKQTRRAVSGGTRKRGGKVESDDTSSDRPRQERMSDPMGNVGGSDRWSREFGSPLPKSGMRDLSDAGEGMRNDSYKRGGRAKRK